MWCSINSNELALWRLDLPHRHHHLHLCATALIIFIFAPPRSSSSSSCRRDHHASAPRSSFVWRLGKFHPPTPPSLHSFGGSINSIHPCRHLSICLTATQLPRRHFFIWPSASKRCHLFICSAGASITAPQSFQRASQSHRCAAIISAGQQIPSPRRYHFSGPVNHIAVPQSFQRAGESYRRAAIISEGR